MRGFEHDHRKIGLRPFGKQLLPFAGFGREEAVEIEIGFGYARRAQCAHHRAGADDGNDSESGFAHTLGKFGAGVAHGGRACVGDLGDGEAV